MSAIQRRVPRRFHPGGATRGGPLLIATIAGALALGGCSPLGASGDLGAYTDEIRDIPGVTLATGTERTGNHLSRETTLHVEMDARADVLNAVRSRVCQAGAFSAQTTEYVVATAHTRVNWSVSGCPDLDVDPIAIATAAESTGITAAITLSRSDRVAARITETAGLAQTLPIARAIAPALEDAPTLLSGDGVEVHAENRAELTRVLEDSTAVSAERPITALQYTDVLMLALPAGGDPTAVSAAFEARDPEAAAAHPVVIVPGTSIAPAESERPDTTALVAWLGERGYATEAATNNRVSVALPNIDTVETLSAEIAERNTGRAAVSLTVAAQGPGQPAFTTVPHPAFRALTTRNNPYPGYADLYRAATANGLATAIELSPTSLRVTTASEAPAGEEESTLLFRLAQERQIPEVYLNGQPLVVSP
ncbi:hypothetical protein D9V32_03255 [Mycetocola tolaasinivorans]|uniref:Uncharacterized protein n=1 Tax=Mycetocola tolaasinivorans TaxID=76635 RepID=A0A3L7ACM1_9MICO|nr:hypothetical protein [Mycetocola tolaasinivorans]RLP77478.1 hypothetical protein D9V32_03255 [Mycetocola tolaasinivorans]